YRTATALFFVGFTYIELLDQAAYLNHYYLISLLALLMVGLPLHGAWSLDAWRVPRLRRTTVPRFQLVALRLQVGLVYVFAGLAKLQSDWLIRAQPLKTWLKAHTEMPLLGPWLGLDVVAQGMSIAGALFDLSLPFALLWRVTRVPALVCLVGFHALTGWLFPIGMFPWIMVTCALLLLPPDWPRKLLSSPSPLPEHPPRPFVPRTWQRLGLTYLLLHFTLQLLLPLRHHLYPGDASWTEEGGRFAWRVMLTEKVGDVRYRIENPRTGKTHTVDPEAFLTPLQAKEMSVQPDMILAFAHFLAHGYAHPVHIYADAWITVNGRPATRLMNPMIDLTQQRESLAPKTWILHASSGLSSAPPTGPRP
ncbi:MAG: HTTM domain-containing protein, partial [Nannocystaceae bacterium]